MKQAFGEMSARFFLSYDHFNFDLITFKVDIISMENTTLSWTSLWCYMYVPKCYVMCGHNTFYDMTLSIEYHGVLMEKKPLWKNQNEILSARYLEKYFWAMVLKLGQLRPKKYICVFQVSALKKLGMVGQHNILFCQNIFYRNCIFPYIFPHFPANLTHN